MAIIKSIKFWLAEIVLLVVALPILAIILSIFNIIFNIAGDIYGLIATLMATILVGCATGGIRGRFIDERERFIPGFLPALLLIFYSLTVWLIMIIVADGDFESRVFYHGIQWFGLYSALIKSALMTEFYEISSSRVIIAPVIPFVGFLSYTIMRFITVRQNNKLENVTGWRSIVLLIAAMTIAISGLLAWQSYDRRERRVVNDPAREITESFEPGAYDPFTPDNKLTALNASPGLLLENDWPRLNGATAVYPVYASAAQALYHKLDVDSVWKYVRCDRTPGAWEKLIHGEADIIFVAEPSAEQKASARAQGVDLHFYPIAREAFVFVTHKDNPLTQLSEKQIRDIYSGRVNNWLEVGGNDARIYPYQRPKGSGSQTIMLAAVMGEDKLRKPLETESVHDMIGLLRNVANYQNSANALGYTFRYYATQLHHSPDLRLLAVNGIEPTIENIRNGKYPYTIDVYMVSAGKPSRQSQKFIDWFLSEQGQRLIADVGYVPLAR
ncbi:phosphate ABC transporter substrate-binding protein [Salmonella enterica]|nr:phosphate ABC transporter substrate-binding protein [Salmonella enterica]